MNTLNLSREGAELLKEAIARQIDSIKLCAKLNVNYNKRDAKRDAEKIGTLELLLDSVSEIVYNYSHQ